MSTTTAIRQVTEADRFTEEQLRMLSDSIMKGATPGEIQFFAEVCKRTNLDPFKRQIHAVQRWDSSLKRMAWTFQTGIDGYIAIAHRDGLCAGIDDVKFLPEDESTPNPRKATCTVWKIVGGQRVPFTASARWEEYVQCTKEGNPNSMWRKMPYGQLGKCATALALRKAFPEELGGVYTDVEMEQADTEHARGEHVKGRPAPQFDLESKPFEQPPKSAEQPAETPPPAKPQAEVVEVAVVTEKPPLPVPAPILKWTRGKWKEAMGDIKGKTLADARQAAIDGSDVETCAQAIASIYDEVQARLAAKNMPEDELACNVVEAGLDGIDVPAALWTKPQHYPAILKIVKA